MTTPQSIRDKISWEGWPEGIEWIDPDNVEDEELRKILQRASDIYLDLEAVRSDLDVRLDELLNGEEEE